MCRYMPVSHPVIAQHRPTGAAPRRHGVACEAAESIRWSVLANPENLHKKDIEMMVRDS